jgi:transposase-like protein
MWIMRFPLEELRRLYLDEGLTPVAIARHYKCSEGTIRAALIRARIPLRNLSQARRLMFGIEIAAEDLRRWYLDERLSAVEIARRMGCSDTTVRRRLKECAIPVRRAADTPLTYPRCDFDGTEQQKAYLIGLRQGDLRVAFGKAGGQSRTIRVEVSSTRAEQLALFRELFAPYGHVWQGRVRDSGRQDLVCHLNFTFDFLLPKRDRVDDWIFSVDENMAAFAAGYVDAEGSFGFNKGDPHFSIDSYDSGILRALHRWFERCGVVCPAPHIVSKKGSYNSGAGVPYSKDVWRLAVYRQRALCNLIDLIRPFVRHAKRRKDMQQVWAIVNQKDG